MKGLASILLGFLVLATLPAAHADPEAPGPAPRNFSATYDPINGTMNLAWSPPGNGTYNYTLYRDGEQLAILQTTSYQDPVSVYPTAYWIVATQGTRQSMPAALILFGQSHVICWPVRVVISTSWPYVDVFTNPECIPILHLAIGQIISTRGPG